MNKTQDPRFIRTRKLIIEAFIKLAMDRDFKDISIGDITKEATINRASFYYHFKDKFDLLEQVMNEMIQTHVIHSIHIGAIPDIDSIGNIFNSIVSFLLMINTQCKKNYGEFKPIIEKILKEKLIHTFNNFADTDSTSGNVCSVMISWALFGAAEHYIFNQISYGELSTYKDMVLRHITNGMLTA